MWINCILSSISCGAVIRHLLKSEFKLIEAVLFNIMDMEDGAFFELEDVLIIIWEFVWSIEYYLVAHWNRELVLRNFHDFFNWHFVTKHEFFAVFARQSKINIHFLWRVNKLVRIYPIDGVWFFFLFQHL